MHPTLRLLAVAALVSAVAHDAFAQQGRKLPERYLADRVLVQTRPGLSTAELDKLLKAHGGKRKQIIKQINVHVVELPPQSNAIAVADALQKNKHVKFAEVDGVFAPQFYPNDPRYSSQWNLPKVGAPSAWDAVNGDGVVIAILDTGVDVTHPDLQAQVVPGWNFFDDNGDVTDIAGHGTTVAGVAAAAANNSIGVASVSFGSRIMPMRVTDANGTGYSSLIAAAITSAADKGARVANVSFLGISYSSTIDSAAQYMRSKGGVVVTASGNTGALRTEPVRDSLTVVAATDSNDVKASFSSWGDYVDVSAPGTSIPTTARGGGYGSASGTSVSSPIVAGVYALLISAKPALTSSALDDILFTSALDLGSKGSDQEYGAGRVDAAAAVQKALGTSTADTQAPLVAITTPSNGQTASGLVPVDVMAQDNLGITKIELYAKNSLVATDTGAPYAFTVDTAPYGDGPLELFTKAYDAAGNVGTSSTVTITVSNDTAPPTVQITNPAMGATVSGTVNVSVAASDDKKVSRIVLKIDGKEVMNSYGASLSYSWTVPSSTTTNTKGNGKGGGKNGGDSTTTSTGGGKGRKSTSTASLGSSTIAAEAFDAAGNSTSTSVTVNY